MSKQRDNVRDLERNLRIKVPSETKVKLPFDVGAASDKRTNKETLNEALMGGKEKK